MTDKLKLLSLKSMKMTCIRVLNVSLDQQLTTDRIERRPATPNGLAMVRHLAGIAPDTPPCLQKVSILLITLTSNLFITIIIERIVRGVGNGERRRGSWNGAERSTDQRERRREKERKSSGRRRTASQRKISPAKDSADDRSIPADGYIWHDSINSPYYLQLNF